MYVLVCFHAMFCFFGPGKRAHLDFSQPGHWPYGWVKGCVYSRSQLALLVPCCAAARCFLQLLHVAAVLHTVPLRHGCGVATAARGAPPRTRTRTTVLTAAATCRHSCGEAIHRHKHDVPHGSVKATSFF